MTTDTNAENFYDFHANSLNGEDVELSQFQDKVVLVVNTASKCGFTPQYAGLEELYKKHHDDGLVILGFPCNQFGGQEPGNSEEIASGCLINYGVSFPMFEKVDVNGKEAHPLFVWLKKKLPGMLGQGIKWNFTKFLVGRDGTPIKRFAPQTSPEKIEPAIREALTAR
ncbi:glutathione peroxidase [Bremerella cremea]|uniref:Glutathione peroxidase n=1 Tax=Bremerella cremea TaxID=1031537 RepID=A0A368KJV8_9BACT|nr:glutathione peroxidase [Bremerella cremea]RCS41047.1 glutathione peroxidase [Bremerella cremea]